jgi:glycosyltransferase involved in cell wall biosynthesis
MTLPFFAVAAARLRGASCALILYDLYPDALVISGLLREGSLATRLWRRANSVLFRWLRAVVIIGRDMEVALSRYRIASDRLVYIPNWVTLNIAVRPYRVDNPFRRKLAARFVVGLFGNLGYTHDPKTVFEAAARLQDASHIHFLVSGSGVGWQELKRMQDEAKLSNMTLVERIPDAELEDYLAAADVWLIPYRRNMRGISVAGRFYNLLAVGRAIIALTEADSEQAQVILSENIGWVLPPEDAARLAEAIANAARDPQEVMEMGRRAAVNVAPRYSRNASIERYRALIGLLAGESAGRR